MRGVSLKTPGLWSGEITLQVRKMQSMLTKHSVLARMRTKLSALARMRGREDCGESLTG